MTPSYLSTAPRNPSPRDLDRLLRRQPSRGRLLAAGLLMLGGAVAVACALWSQIGGVM